MTLSAIACFIKVGSQSPNPLMSFTRYLFSLALLFLPLAGRGAETAQARMYCLSPRFQHSTDQSGEFTLDLTTLSFGVNGELAFGDFFGGNYSHSTYLIVTDIIFGDQGSGYMELNVPDGGDANDNGYFDFYEVSQAVSATTSGHYSVNGFGSGAVTASWYRSANSKDGSCTLTLSSSFGPVVFVPQFELIEYTGPLTYTPGSNTVSGSVNLTQTGNTNNHMQGPVQFVKVATNRFNRLTLQAGAWTNDAMQTLTFTNDPCFRDPPWLTNYFCYVDFSDWDPNTGDVDYPSWDLSIDDTNDFNHNAIPDFSDDPPPRRPLLSLARASTNLSLTISGDVGHPHLVQESVVLPPTNWQTVASITLTNDPQAVSLPLPSGRTKFWRVLAQ